MRASSPHPSTATQVVARPDPRRPCTALVFAAPTARAAEPMRVLGADGWECMLVNDSERARWLASVRNFGLIVVVGDTAPWTVPAVTSLRALTQSPVVALAHDLDRVHAHLLRAGADMALPADCPGELFRSAVGAVSRRVPAAEPTLRFLAADGLRVDLSARTTLLHGASVKLTATEFDVLQLLMRQSQIAVRHHEIIKAVWNWKYTDERNALRLHINRLRTKLAASDGTDRYIRSVRGVGYAFVLPVAEFADDPHEARAETARGDSNLLVEGRLRDLVHTLVRAPTREQACATLVATVVYEGLCDAAAVFARHRGADALHLVAQAGMPPEWEAAVASGIPLSGHFLASETFNSQQIRNYVDISKLDRRYAPSVRLLRQARLPAQLSIPLVGRAGVWGQLGFGRRADSAFTTAQCAVLESAGGVLGALFAEQPRAVAAAS